MTSLDLDAYWPPVDSENVVKTPRKHTHRWQRTVTMDGTDTPPIQYLCLAHNPPVVRDETRARRGKSARRLGHDGERRSEKRYGWRKVGEYGGITDLEGTLAIVQQKTSRRAPPLSWKSIFAALEARAGGRIPLVLLSYVKAGVDTEDFILIRGRDWLQLHGRDDPDAAKLCDRGHELCTDSCGNCPTCFMHEKDCTFWATFDPTTGKPR